MTGPQKIVAVRTVAAGAPLTVQFHEKPHADELASTTLIEEFATAEFMSAHVENANDIVGGSIQLGIGKGKFNDHERRKEGKKSSATMEVAEALGITKHPAVAGIIRHVHKVDSSGGAGNFDITNVIKEFGKQDFPLEEILAWARLAFNAKIGELAVNKDFSLQHIGMLIIAEHGEEIGYDWLQKGMDVKVGQHREFFLRAKADFVRSSKVSRIFGPKGQLILVVTESDSPEISRFARSRHGANADIVVNRRSTGNVSIMVSNQARLDLGDMVAAIKLEEQDRRGKIVNGKFDDLRAPGTIDPDWDVWHYIHGVMLLNGSHTASNVSPSLIPLEVIVKIIEAMLDPKRFAPQFRDTCRIGVCKGKECPWYGIGVRRCLSIRATSAGGDDAQLL